MGFPLLLHPITRFFDSLDGAALYRIDGLTKKGQRLRLFLVFLTAAPAIPAVSSLVIRNSHRYGGLLIESPNQLNV
jgi:hypothetical protein